MPKLVCKPVAGKPLQQFCSKARHGPCDCCSCVLWAAKPCETCWNPWIEMSLRTWLSSAKSAARALIQNTL